MDTPKITHIDSSVFTNTCGAEAYDPKTECVHVCLQQKHSGPHECRHYPSWVIGTDGKLLPQKGMAIVQ